MATDAEKSKVKILNSEYYVGETVKLKLGTIKVMACAEGYVMARYNSQYPFIDKEKDFLDRVKKNL